MSDDFVNDQYTDRLLSTKEVAFRLGTTRVVIGKLIKYKIIPAISFGRHNKISAFRLNRFIEACEGMDVLAIIDEYEQQNIKEVPENIAKKNTSQSVTPARHCQRTGLK